MAKVNAKKAGAKTEKKETVNVFADGFIVFKPNEKAPDFVKANIKIDINKLSEWCVANEDKLKDYKGSPQLSLTLKESKEGTMYASVDLFGTEYANENSLPF